MVLLHPDAGAIALQPRDGVQSECGEQSGRFRRRSPDGYTILLGRIKPSHWKLLSLHHFRSQHDARSLPQRHTSSDPVLRAEWLPCLPFIWREDRSKLDEHHTRHLQRGDLHILQPTASCWVYRCFCDGLYLECGFCVLPQCNSWLSKLRMDASGKRISKFRLRRDLPSSAVPPSTSHLERSWRVACRSDELVWARSIRAQRMQPYDSDVSAARAIFPEIWCHKVIRFSHTNEAAQTRKQPQATRDST